MEQPQYILKSGTKVLTNSELDTTKGMMVNPLYLGARKVNATGVVLGPVPGHGGDVYWVDHGEEKNDDIAVYCFTEFELASISTGVPELDQAMSDGISPENLSGY